MNFTIRVIGDNRAASAIEYGLIAALIAVAAIGALTKIGSALRNSFKRVSSNLL